MKNVSINIIIFVVQNMLVFQTENESLFTINPSL